VFPSIFPTPETELENHVICVSPPGTKSSFHALMVYESVPKYDKLQYIETLGMPIDWRVEKMRLSKDKTQLKYNDFLTLDGIPAEVLCIGWATVLRWSGWWISIASR